MTTKCKSCGKGKGYWWVGGAQDKNNAGEATCRHCHDMLKGAEAHRLRLAIKRRYAWLNDKTMYGKLVDRGCLGKCIDEYIVDGYLPIHENNYDDWLRFFKAIGANVLTGKWRGCKAILYKRVAFFVDPKIPTEKG